MKNRMFTPLLGAVVLLTCLASGASAVNLYLNNLPTNGVMGGVYTSPYGISVGTQTSTPLPLICDDFTTDIGVPSSWPATVTTLTSFSSSTVSSLKFADPAYQGSGVLGGPTGVAEDYEILAVLAAELTMLPDQNSAAGAELSYAIWSVFDQTLYNNLINNGSTGYGNVMSGTGGQSDAVTQIKNYLLGAEALVETRWNAGNTSLSGIMIDGVSLDSLTVYTASPASQSQEFLQVTMPEPSYPAVLALDLLAVVGLIVAFRGRLARTVS